MDDRSATVTFTNGTRGVTATLMFNDRDELVDFWSDDRPDSSTGTFVPMRWSTPVTEYRDLDGLHLLHGGAAVYLRPDGPFTYGEFTMSSIQYDLWGPMPTERRLLSWPHERGGVIPLSLLNPPHRERYGDRHAAGARRSPRRAVMTQVLDVDGRAPAADLAIEVAGSPGRSARRWRSTSVDLAARVGRRLRAARPQRRRQDHDRPHPDRRAATRSAQSLRVLGHDVPARSTRSGRASASRPTPRSTSA